MSRQPKAPRPILDSALGHDASDKRIDLLRRVGEGGSISEAARAAGVSYKAAWQAIDTLSNLAGTPLVESAVGGAGGGGARLTPAGRELLQASAALTQARRQVLQRLAGAAPGNAPAAGWAALGLRTSMRNQLPCSVAALEGQGQVVRVQLQLASGAPLASRITRESAELLGLVPGQPVLALCKAMAVAVARAPAAGSPQAAGLPRNLLEGRASRISRGETGDEVSATLEGGLQLVGFAPAGSGLRTGSRVVLAVDEAAVVIALAG